MIRLKEKKEKITFLKEQGVYHHYGLAIYIKRYFKTKEELRKLKYFTMQKYTQSSKKPFKKNQNPSRYHSSITNLKFQYKPKYHLPKILIYKK